MQTIQLPMMRTFNKKRGKIKAERDLPKDLPSFSFVGPTFDYFIPYERQEDIREVGKGW